MSGLSTVEERLREGLRLKEAGNEKFKVGEFMEAVRLYKRVLLYTKGLDTGRSEFSQYSTALGRPMPSSDQEVEARNLTVSVLSNLGAAYLQLNDPSKAATYCAKVLDLMPDNVKVLFRLGQAHHRLGDLCRADEMLTRAAKLPTKVVALARNIRDELRVVRGKLKEKEAKFGKGFAAAFRAAEAAEASEGDSPTPGRGGGGGGAGGGAGGHVVGASEGGGGSGFGGAPAAAAAEVGADVPSDDEYADATDGGVEFGAAPSDEEEE